MSQGPVGSKPILLDDSVLLRPASAVDRGVSDRDVVARAELRMLPKPRLALVADDTPFRLDSVKESWMLVEPRAAGVLFDVTPQPSPSSRLEDKVRQFGEILEATGQGRIRRRPTDDARELARWNLVFLPRHAPILVERRREAARRLQLEILNSPVFGGDATKTVQLLGGLCRVGHLALEAPPWRIEFTEKPALGGVGAELNASRGFAPTPEVRIDRADGGPIEQEEARRLLEALDRFFSFARGVGCAAAVVRRFSRDDAVVWEQWGCRRVAPWRPEPDSWFDAEHGQALSEALTRFLHTWEASNDEWAALRGAIYWYVTGHWESSRVDGGLILLQAAMERMAHSLYFQAWTLGRWLVELMVLNAIGYQGCYSNRLREGRVEGVPWARTKQFQPATQRDGE